MYHSHPDYCIMGPWHDWVMVTFAMNGNHVLSQSMRQKHRKKYFFQLDEYPCKNFGFLKCRDNGEIMAVVQSCKENEHKNDSILYQRWEKRPTMLLEAENNHGCIWLLLMHLMNVYW